MSTEFQVFLQSNLICYVRSVPFHCSTNGQAERMVQTAKESLRRIMERDWEYRLVTFFMGPEDNPEPNYGMQPSRATYGPAHHDPL